VEFL
jgi:hypothetical protein